MISNVCKIEKGTRDLAAILKESEKVAVYNELTHKQTLQLRLLCEEIDGMLPNVIDEFGGELWIEFTDGVCRVHISIEFADFTAEKKQELVGISKNKKNASALGIVGKIRSAVEDFFLDEEVVRACAMSTDAHYLTLGYNRMVDYTHTWSLEQYKRKIEESEKKSEAWDELEKSVIASVADDVTVGVKGKKADIIIVKNFN